MSDFSDFIDEHKGESPDRLRLRFRGDARQWVSDAINHIEALPKGRRKHPQLPSEWVFPSVVSVEQSTPPAVAALNHKAAVELYTRLYGVSTGPLRVLDMTAGLGIDALQFVIAGAQVTICELNQAHAGALRRNFGRYEGVTVVEGDSVEWLNRYTGAPFDIIFIDPARRDKAGTRLYNLHDCSPDLIELLPLLKAKSRLVATKLSPMLDVTQTLRDLPGRSRLLIAEDGGECRELLALIPSEASDGSCIVEVCRPEPVFSYDFSEGACNIPYADPEAGMWLTELSPAMMKSGRYDLLCRDFGLSMVAPNSRLFVSDRRIDAAIGTCLPIVRIYDLTSGNLRKTGKEVGAAEVVARNLPGLTSDILRKRLGVKESGAKRVVGTTLRRGRKVILLLDKGVEPA